MECLHSCNQTTYARVVPRQLIARLHVPKHNFTLFHFSDSNYKIKCNCNCKLLYLYLSGFHSINHNFSHLSHYLFNKSVDNFTNYAGDVRYLMTFQCPIYGLCIFNVACLWFFSANGVETCWRKWKDVTGKKQINQLHFFLN